MTHPIYEAPPLVEIVAEVRWGQGLTGNTQVFVETDDAVYMKLAVEVNKLGYNQFERVLPSGLPVPAGAVVYRYRKISDDQHTLFQLGAGVFTVNALPPYTSWSEYRPAIRNGLLAAYASGAIPREEPYQLILRYIDAFSGQSLLERSPFQLMAEMLNMTFASPAVVDSADQDMPELARFSVEYPLAENGLLSIELGEAQWQGSKALIMNTRAHAEGVLSNDPEVLLTKFDQLHRVLRDVFDEMLQRVAVQDRGVTQ